MKGHKPGDRLAGSIRWKRVIPLLLLLVVLFCLAFFLPGYKRLWMEEETIEDGAVGTKGTLAGGDEPASKKGRGPFTPYPYEMTLPHSKNCVRMLDKLASQGRLGKYALFMVINVTGDFHEWLNFYFNMSLENKLTWAKVHGDMDVVLFRENHDPGRPAFWMKVCFIHVHGKSDGVHSVVGVVAGRVATGVLEIPDLLRQERRVVLNTRDSHLIILVQIAGALNLLPYYDWIVFFDIDGLITNMGVTIEDLISRRGSIKEKYPKEVDLVVGKTFEYFGLDKGDGVGDELKGETYRLNTGAWLLRNTPWSYDFLERDYAQTKYTDFSNHEQRAMQVLLRENPEDREHVLYLDEHEINIHNWRWQKDDFFIHYFGGMQCQNKNQPNCRQDFTEHFEAGQEQANDILSRVKQRGEDMPTEGLFFECR